MILHETKRKNPLDNSSRRDRKNRIRLPEEYKIMSRSIIEEWRGDGDDDMNADEGEL